MTARCCWSARSKSLDRGVSRISAVWRGRACRMRLIGGVRDPWQVSHSPTAADDADERRQANRAVVVSAVGLALTGVIELATRWYPTRWRRWTYGRAEDLAGIGVALVIWASAVAAGFESVTKLLRHGGTTHPGRGIAAAVVGIVGNQFAARYKLVVGRRSGSATMVADAKHSRLDALSSAGAMVGLIGVALGWGWADAIAGIIVTGFICHVGREVTSDIAQRLLDGVDPRIITTAETVATAVQGADHAHARAPLDGRTRRVEVEGFLDPDRSDRPQRSCGARATNSCAVSRGRGEPPEPSRSTTKSPHYQSIAEPGACGKTRVMPQNRWPKPELAESGLRSASVVGGGQVAPGTGTDIRPCGGGCRSRSDRADVGRRVGIGRSRRGPCRAAHRPGPDRLACRRSVLTHHRGPR